LPEHDIGAANRYSDDYEMATILQSTQAWRWRMQVEHKRYAKNDKRRVDVPENDVDVNEDADLNEDK
jgi:hypothetical protein